MSQVLGPIIIAASLLLGAGLHLHWRHTEKPKVDAWRIARTIPVQRGIVIGQPPRLDATPRSIPVAFADPAAEDASEGVLGVPVELPAAPAPAAPKPAGSMD